MEPPRTPASRLGGRTHPHTSPGPPPAPRPRPGGLRYETRAGRGGRRRPMAARTAPPPAPARGPSGGTGRAGPAAAASAGPGAARAERSGAGRCAGARPGRAGTAGCRDSSPSAAMSGPSSPGSPPPGESLSEQPLGPDLLRCPRCRLLLWEPVTASCGHSFCKPCLGGAGPSRCPLCQERLELPGAGEARCSVVLCGLLERCVPRERRLAGLAQRVRHRLARGDAREALRMAQRGVELGKERRARGLGVRGVVCGVLGASTAAPESRDAAQGCSAGMHGLGGRSR